MAPDPLARPRRILLARGAARRLDANERLLEMRRLYPSRSPIPSRDRFRTTSHLRAARRAPPAHRPSCFRPGARNAHWDSIAVLTYHAKSRFRAQGSFLGGKADSLPIVATKDPSAQQEEHGCAPKRNGVTHARPEGRAAGSQRAEEKPCSSPATTLPGSHRKSSRRSPRRTRALRSATAMTRSLEAWSGAWRRCSSARSRRSWCRPEPRRMRSRWRSSRRPGAPCCATRNAIWRPTNAARRNSSGPG